MEIRLDGTVMLVTGASSGIGEAIARHAGESGAKVAVHYNRNEKRARELADSIGNGSDCFQADLEEPSNARVLFDSVVEKMGKVDVLVNNAGIFFDSPVDLGSDEWLEHWSRTQAVNLASAAMLCHAAINHFRSQAGGRIINIASRAAFRGETKNYLAYAASKGGMVSLSRSIARSFGKENIKSFVIAPGWVRTPMTEEILDRIEKDMIENELALGEITLPGDIAPLVVLIAGGRLDHATGCTIDINAGSYMR